MGGSSEGQEVDEGLESVLLEMDKAERSNLFDLSQISRWDGFRTRKEEITNEAKKQLGLAGPLIGVSILQYFLQVISLMYVGHLGKLPLSGASMASSFAFVTGFSFLVGMGSTLETLCGQAYGAEQYHMLGINSQRAMLVLFLLCITLSLFYLFTSQILISLGQDPEISTEAGAFNRCMIPGLFAYSLIQCLNRFLMAQNDALPMMVCSAITACLHVLVCYCWILVFPVGLGGVCAALANSASYWINVCLLAGYMKFSSSCLKTWTGFSCTIFLLVMVSIALTEGVVVGVNTIFVRHVLGRLYSSEGEVVEYVKKMMPLLALSDFLDGFQCILSEAARGCGWQNLCACINLGAYYIVAIPTAVVFAFVLHIRGMGLWMGIICGLVLQVVAIVTVNFLRISSSCHRLIVVC